ncbi:MULTISPECIES: hypothetical protein [unclassified Brenneria]|uniref:hypothetical protein n=1 Tax=unclassified Brenneria TaxID=2634434 RepID=UPI0018F07CA9|nr:hypothetical protein [Brenneria sp. L3-3C-1]MBJ7223388.1 hypothetical protein [Brenneria sp. L3-3C-1]MEE3644628.1 hypothetical protein [Brenneria sp. L3_3C_1]
MEYFLNYLPIDEKNVMSIPQPYLPLSGNETESLALPMSVAITAPAFHERFMAHGYRYAC